MYLYIGLGVNPNVLILSQVASLKTWYQNGVMVWGKAHGKYRYMTLKDTIYSVATWVAPPSLQSILGVGDNNHYSLKKPLENTPSQHLLSLLRKDILWFKTHLKHGYNVLSRAIPCQDKERHSQTHFLPTRSQCLMSIDILVYFSTAVKAPQAKQLGEEKVISSYRLQSII